MSRKFAKISTHKFPDLVSKVQIYKSKVPSPRTHKPRILLQVSMRVKLKCCLSFFKCHFTRGLTDFVIRVKTQFYGARNLLRRKLLRCIVYQQESGRVSASGIQLILFHFLEIILLPGVKMAGAVVAILSNGILLMYYYLNKKRLTSIQRIGSFHLL